MFENGFFGFFKSGDKPATSQEQTWNPTTMTMEPPRNYSGSSTEQLEVCLPDEEIKKKKAQID